MGFALVYLPSTIVTQYERAQRLGGIWATLYLLFVGSGSLILLSLAGLGVYRVFGATWRKRRNLSRRAKNPSQLSADEKLAELDANLRSVEEIGGATYLSQEMREQLRKLAADIASKRKSEKLEIVAFGTISSGKSSLLNALAGRDVFDTDLRGGTTVQRNEIPWPGNDQVLLVDTPGLGEIDGQQHASIAAQAARDSDMVLLVVDGPLREFEHELLEQLGAMEKRIIVCLNKEDWYTDRDRQELVGQLTSQVATHVCSDNIVAVRSRPTERPRKRVLTDGSEIEEMVPVEPNIEPLAQRMMHILRRDGRDLLLGNLLLQSRGLMDQAKLRVQEALDQRAWEIVDRYTWSAGGAAALSPFPMIDLAAGCAISTKMVFDLARVYHQDIDAEAAVNLLGQLGKNLISVLGASVATPLVATGIASLLKTVPGVGTIAGGLLQGIVQALVTRWIGAIFIDYYKHEMTTPQGGIAELARRHWDKLTTISELRKLVTTAKQKFSEDQT